uniref:Uncharacterized protein AlNc14C83G5371 n=1 Tax=Albugo laibachii Nc14 TaxID=890382 RepID=F0WFI6_9STRA|nr:conserved hypothetical protein [Albugo laibachii Nc14]|eukprot:CCA19968.1 conserved hypothetical protein [Albugo laibachii Nc14]
MEMRRGENANISQTGSSGGGSNNGTGFSVSNGSASNTASPSVPSISSGRRDPPEYTKKLSKFYTSDRPPRKRLRNVLDFLKNPIQESGAANLVGMAVTALTGGSTSKLNLTNALYSSENTLSGSQDTNHESKDANTENDAGVMNPTALAVRRILKDFWSDPGNASIFFLVVNDCITEMESMYTPHENVTFRKIRQKKQILDVDDWTDVFEGLEILIRNNRDLIRTGWKKNGFTLLFLKLLQRENHAIIKKYAFRCLALYTDAMRSLSQFQLVEMHPTAGATMILIQVANSNGEYPFAGIDTSANSNNTNGSGHTGTGSTQTEPHGTANAHRNTAGNTSENGESLGSFPAAATGAQVFQSLFNECVSSRSCVHLDLLRESIDFSPFAGTTNSLPDKFMNDGTYVEGWVRPNPTQAEEPVDMLRFLMDLSLEKDRNAHAPEDKSAASAAPSPPISNGKVPSASETDRFEFWCELIMRFFMPILYPKVCHKVGLKEESDTFGFFHHCPGSFQRVVARWLFKLRAREDCMEIIWSKREFAELVMETFRQRFMYRDSDLIMDAIKFYGAVCTETNQYLPVGMKLQMNETVRAMISHVSQLFHPSVQLEDSKLLLHCIELLEVIAQRSLDEYTNMYLRKFVLSTIENCSSFRDPVHGGTILNAMLAITFHVWMHSNVINKSSCSNSVWMELVLAIRRWLIHSSDQSFIILENEVVACWRRELRFTSCLVMYLLDQRQGTLKTTVEGAVLLPPEHAPSLNESISSATRSKDRRQGYIQSASTFLSANVQTAHDAMILLDRVLHLIPPMTMASVPPSLHYHVLQGLLQLIELWIDTAIAPPLVTAPKGRSSRASRSALRAISPSTLIALFGKWFIPACESENTEMINSRCVALVILCKLCTVRSLNPLAKSHAALLLRILFCGITSSSGLVVSTVLQQASRVFTLNLDGTNVLIPAFLHTIDRVIIQNISDRAERSKYKTSEWTKELEAALQVAFSLLGTPKHFADQDLVNWKEKIQESWRHSADSMSPSEREALEGGWEALIDKVPEMKEPTYVILGRIFVRIRTLPFSDIESIQQRALWGLYSIIAMNLTIPIDQTPRVESRFLSAWIIHILDASQASDFTISMTALHILQDLATDYHAFIAELEPGSLMERIVMTLAVFAQQQVEEASFEVQAEIEKNAIQGESKGFSRAPTSSSGVSTSSRDSSRHSKPKSDTRNRISPTPSPSWEASTGKSENPTLKLIFHKTSSIFDCLKVWVMARPEILHDNDVKTILFDAIEAALIGVLPEGEWQKEVEKRRIRDRRLSIPLLFVGLQMRASLDQDASSTSNPASVTPDTWLRCFEETALAAEGLLLHLLHHLNGFPSTGMDQMTSNCAEWSNGNADYEQQQPILLRFVLMNAIIVTVVGSLESQSCRFIARDMTGLFTWELAPVGDIVATATSAMRDHVSAPIPAHIVVEMPEKNCESAAVRLEGKSSTQEANAIEKCAHCGLDKAAPPRSKDSGLQVTQIAWDVEKRILDNTICTQPSAFVFHAKDASKESTKSESKVETPDTQTNSKSKRVCKCKSPKVPKRDRIVSICGLFELHMQEPNIGSLNNERCLLDLVLDSIPILFRDCCNSSDVIDKTLLGGRYAWQRYQHLEILTLEPPTSTSSTWLLENDPSEVNGLSFLERFIHDEECFTLWKAFMLKAYPKKGKDWVEFCEAVKRFERTAVLNERLGQACLIYWEFFSLESPKKLLSFPFAISGPIQSHIQSVQKSLRSIEGVKDKNGYASICFPGSLFQQAIGYLEQQLMESGVLDHFLASLAIDKNAKPKRKEAHSGGVPTQLALFDAFSIMEINGRTAFHTLELRKSSKELIEMAQFQALPPLFSPDPLQQRRVNAMDLGRLFLMQSNLIPCLNADHTGNNLQLLHDDGTSGKLERSIKHLDKSPTRETMKIGVLYVGPMQQTQQEILANDQGSSMYEQFLGFLGWKVDLLQHSGFIGGLDCNPKSLSNGKMSYYYANAHTEVMFHVVTCMPTKENDAQQIDKKRHVGNDFVHIVWNENDRRGYAAGTITSHFNDVQIVIYPLRKAKQGMFLLEIFAKEKLTAFGPLQSGMVVDSLHDLAILVRQTAMNANRMCRAQSALYLRPYPTRKKLVEEIIERYAVQYSDAQWMHWLFTSKGSASSPE